MLNIVNVYMNISALRISRDRIIYVASIVLLCVFSSSVSSERVRIPNIYTLNLVLILSSSDGIFFPLTVRE